MKKSFATAVLILVSSWVFGQGVTPDHAVMIPIRQLFEGMKSGDSAKVRTAFVDDPSLVTVFKTKTGQSKLVREPLSEFTKAVGTPHTESWNEPIWDVVIQVDGILAQVWAKYGFYLGKKFSHCGVDTFQLLLGDDGNWKIFHLADTRQKEGCNVPDVISKEFR